MTRFRHRTFSLRVKNNVVARVTYVYYLGEFYMRR